MGIQPFRQHRQQRQQRAPTETSDDVADEQDPGLVSDGR
jgi:hypothetical protein